MMSTKEEGRKSALSVKTDVDDDDWSDIDTDAEDANDDNGAKRLKIDLVKLVLIKKVDCLISLLNWQLVV